MAKTKNLDDVISDLTEKPVLNVENVLLKDIYPCDKNPRKTMDEDAIIDLAKSMHDVGLLQPITIRPDDGSKYEIVAGHRRYKAAEMLKWHSIPSIIRKVGDEELLEIQVIENLLREDVSPMDEAAAFKSVLQRENFEWLCSRIHKGRKYISDRLKLNDLVEDGQSHVHKGTLPLSHAIMISKLPVDEQKKCLKKCIDDDFFIDKEVCVLTINQLREFIENNLMIDLERACFDLEDTELLPAAGSCAACTKRTCNQNLLFAEITEDDKCTDAACYHAKEQAHVTATLKKAKEDHGRDSVYSGQTDGYNTSYVKVRGVSVPFAEKKAKGKDQVCVVVTKADSFGNNKKLGETVWVDRKDIEGKVKEKEERKASNSSNNGHTYWQEQEKKDFTEVIHPRLLKIASLLEAGEIANSETIALNFIKERFDALPDRDVIAFASVIGIYKIDDDKLWEADDDIDWSVRIRIIEKIIAHFQEKGFSFLLIILALLHTVDSTDEARTAEEIDLQEDIAFNWNELMELIEGKKGKPAKKNAKKAAS